MAKRVLIIDDDYDFHDINKAILENAGYETLSAYGSHEGIEMVKKELPDLIILDIMFDKSVDGDYDGLAVIQDIRRDNAIKDIPVIMITSINTDNLFSWHYGIDDTLNPVDVFMDKPVKPTQILAEIKKLIGE